MFRFARICVDHQSSGCKKGANCQYLHVCAVYLIGGHCDAGDKCALGHRIDDTFFSKLPLPAEWNLQQKLRYQQVPDYVLFYCTHYCTVLCTTSVYAYLCQECDGHV